jgi:hypothetical protein
MWRDPFSSTSQFSIGATPISGIGGEALRLETKALLRSVDHGLRGVAVAEEGGRAGGG